MAPVLPSSLSPHVCILPSPDLEQLLQAAHLPPLHDILQSFSPLPQVTTRTVTLGTVPHTAFALRFSNLADIEEACHEDEEKRATRFIDWIGDRTNRQCASWLEELERNPDPDPTRTPWWDELRRCVQGDHVPSKTEAWNHPASIILAVSTTAPNPLQAITALHSRILEFPSWVDTTHLLYTLIIHSRESALSDEEAGALFNAVKRQYGLHAYLLPLSLPSPPPPPVPVPALLPRLPPQSVNVPQNASQHSPVGSRLDSQATSNTVLNTLRMSEQDIQQMARFAREFVVMSLVPWMEKCVLEWNESYSSSRRLPSRLFSSTRRLFGTSTPTTQTPVHAFSSSVSSLPSRSHTYSSSQTSMSGSTVLIHPPSQQRRLAEFATVLGDFKLAVGVWESLRKESKGGSDILPLLLSPSPAVALHVSNALSSLHSRAPELPPQAQLQALTYAVRWEAGISTNDFLDDVLEGERWLVWAAGNAEEPPSALLLAHAALLSARKNAKRRAALWYLFAANRLEKCGIKPLTMYFLRKAHDLFNLRQEKLLSPSFWDSEAKLASNYAGFHAVMSGIEHPLGRLLYTTGDTTGAVKLFLGLLRWSSASSPLARFSHDSEDEAKEPSASNKVYVEDFRVALTHLKSVSGPQVDLRELILPVTFAIPASTRVRLPRDSVGGDELEWERKEEVWRSFWRSCGKETLEKSGKAAVGETFWVDIVLRNPLDTEVTLANLTAVLEAKNHDASWILQHIYVESVDEITLGAKESRTISIAMKSSRAAALTIPSIKYDFLGLLPSTESLACRGRRLQDTLQQRQSVIYAPDILIKLDVEEASQELAVSFVGDEPLVLNEGECKQMELRILNAGSSAIGEVWVVGGSEDQMWFGSSTRETPSIVDERCELLRTDNKLPPWAPYNVPVNQELLPQKSTKIPLTWRPVGGAKQDLCLLFIYRETAGRAFHCTRVTRSYAVNKCLQVSAALRPMSSVDEAFLLDLDISNMTSGPLRITQLTTISPSWKCSPSTPLWSESLQPAQSARLSCSMNPAGDQNVTKETVAFVSRKVGDVLNGREVEATDPPPLDLICDHIACNDHCFSMCDAVISHLVRCERLSHVSASISHSHPHIPAGSHPHIFPLYHPLSADILVFWEIPGEQRHGFTLLSDLSLGAGHAALREVIAEVEGAKIKRSMYAETQREKLEILQAIRNSQWNAETNPLTVAIQDGVVVEHDFTKGPCIVPVTFQVRNHSLTHLSRFLIKLDPSGSSSDTNSPSKLLQPKYAGRLTIRGNLRPAQSTLVQTSVWVSHPGTYSLSGWQIETEVGEVLPSSGGPAMWRTRQRYVQGSPADHHPCLTVVGVHL